MTAQTKSLSLSELQKEVAKIVDERFIENIWVIAEISEMKINYSGHAYLELIEKSKSNDSIISKARAIIWSRQARMIMPYFETTTGSSLNEGMKILIRVSVEYHELYGLNLIINDIDPSYSVGEIALKRRDIINQLEKEGVINMNQECSYPLLPQRIAIISSSKAAGYTDFIHQLRQNQGGYKFTTKLYEATMQGEETTATVTTALNKIHEKIEETDIVVIVRGGGSQADLSWFDNYSIAYMITQFPIPVLTGIGHEKDISVADIVAFESFKTPTAVADYIIESVRSTEEYLHSIWRSIREISLQSIKKNGDLLNSKMARIIPSVTSRISKHRELLTKLQHSTVISSTLLIEKKKNLTKTIINSLHREIPISLRKKSDAVVSITKGLKNLTAANFRRITDQLQFIERSIQNVSPEAVLKRGYSITTLNGKTISAANILNKGDHIITRLFSGRIESKVFEIKK